MMLVKMLLTSTSFATGFEGGPIFPLLFIGGTLGQALSEILTFIPQGVGVLAGMAGARMCFLSDSLNTCPATRVIRRANRPYTSHCHRSSNRFHSVEGTHTITSQTSPTAR